MLYNIDHRAYTIGIPYKCSGLRVSSDLPPNSIPRSNTLSYLSGASVTG